MSKTVLVTGASSGIGYQICKDLLTKGGRVIGLSRTIDKSHPLNEFEQFIPWQCDLSDITQAGDLFQSLIDNIGPIDALIYAAGVCYHEQFGQTKINSITEQLNVNLISAFLLCEQAIAHMPKQSTIILLSSTLAEKPIATSAMYSASKAGLEQVMKASAIAGAAKQISVNAVALGCVDTPMLSQHRDDNLEQQTRLKALADLHPFGLGKAHEVAQIITTLLFQPWTTGSVIKVDGGLSLN
ncbi:SDR family oxidoreductase [Pseudoalteromonas luteoviolacea]|uniref:SDR family NAD(P)-dependent oxidoreductase n=1 Tax=Pseudoalteromonas luteoviolacea TaxID=43657 RepID=UPI001B3A4840|nr:SDR family oxidoreductase [Pseudoalteromonas luteoviolacea]MBQ4878801.1 SDR family oxidoreductase [Pseudoalteromonas luteoviolacea]MBQ4907791.1 SDR family oxidoreductase [Pseudoalteromonas luteoviolacea]